MFRPPFVEFGFQATTEEEAKHALNFSDNFGKKIDEDNGEASDEPLSLLGRLFEIYFVRLIGTPNQNSKSDVSFGCHQV
jgi:hypothetical protein